ncbi:MAG: cyclopropane-fatty-acyl-phospholipid synthase family protein [Planctomycetota bacterium]
MKQSAVATAGPDQAPRSTINRTARRLVLKRFKSITDGRIELRDAHGQWSFGTMDPSALHAHMTVHDLSFYRSVVLLGSLGAAESYMRGEWSTDDPAMLLRIFARNLDQSDSLERGSGILRRIAGRTARFVQRNSTRGSRRNIVAHYDLGNEFFKVFLDETLTYSSGVFESPDMTMADASRAKIHRLCRKLRLNADDHLLEIGTGWGTLSIEAARTYGCRVTTTTISDEQFAMATQRVADAGLSDRITVLKQDYRTLDGTFDKLVTVEMIEAVGHEYLPEFFRTCADRLKPDGVMAHQIITMPEPRYDQYRRSMDFIRKYIFPGSCCPSLSAVQNASTQYGMKLTHLEDITPSYVRTLATWRETFMSHLDDVREQGFDDQFIRMWEFYLAYCEAGFAERLINVVQVTMAKPMARPEPMLGALPAQERVAG